MYEKVTVSLIRLIFPEECISSGPRALCEAPRPGVRHSSFSRQAERTPLEFIATRTFIATRIVIDNVGNPWPTSPWSAVTDVRLWPWIMPRALRTLRTWTSSPYATDLKPEAGIGRTASRKRAADSSRRTDDCTRFETFFTRIVI